MTLFEAAFQFDDVVMRTDILTRQSVNDLWKLYEVKATTYKSNDEGRTEDFRQDIAIQAWVLRQCGIALEGVYLLHLNSECLCPNLDSLFIARDYWPEISPLLGEIPTKLEKQKKMLRNQALPNISLGPHCEKSESCFFKETCWNHIPNLPFQFSCHIQRDEDSKLEHYEFLHGENNDPRLTFIQKMLEVIPQSGSIVVYHQTYEISRFKELAIDFPQYAQAISDLIPRVVDLKKVIMDTVYYPAFLGSFSIKKVAPVLLGDEASYQHLEVDDGIEARLCYQKLLNFNLSDTKKEEIRKQLLKYCKQDTLLMVNLHCWLYDNSAL